MSKVVILGGGVAGLSAAHELVLRGFEVEVYELPSEDEMIDTLGDVYVYFKPKDIVSGDFYWYYETNEYFFYATADCTGHGVPGGFMSMLGISLLNEIVKDKKIEEPCDILDLLSAKIVADLKQT